MCTDAPPITEASGQAILDSIQEKTRSISKLVELSEKLVKLGQKRQDTAGSNGAAPAAAKGLANVRANNKREQRRKAKACPRAARRPCLNVLCHKKQACCSSASDGTP